MRLFLYCFVFCVLPTPGLGQTATQNLGDELALALNAGQLDKPENQHLPLEAFDAAYDNGAIVLQWRTAAEVNNARFEVERSVRTHDDGQQPWTTLSFVPGNGTTDSLITYAYFDRGDVAGISQMLYRLKQVSFDGSFLYSEAVEAKLPIPRAYSASSYPNPYTISATIEYDIPSESRVRLTIYDAEGRLLKTLVNARKPAGRYRVVFDASNKDPGLYMYRLEMGGRVWVEPMLLVQ